MRGSETMNRYLCLVILAVGAAVLPSGAADMKDYPLIVYRGTLIDGTQFDANDSTEFNVNGVVKGFSEGISNMKVGGTAIITMP